MLLKPDNALVNCDLAEITRQSKPYSYPAKAAKVLEQFGAQIGEFGWHAIHVDNTLDAVSEQHAASMWAIIHRMGFKNPKILELGTYAHYSSQIAAYNTNGSSASHDISAASLRVGQNRARERGFGANHINVAGDFHNLPFEDSSFDLVFVASAIHHTRKPWEVLQEMLRVTRAGGVVHLENEPVARAVCLYQFRGNREGSRTPFEEEIERLGLTWTVSSPFPGSRSEELFGMVENDGIPLEFYEDVLLPAGHILQWQMDSFALMGPFETWLLSKPSCEEIAARLIDDIEHAAIHFSERDHASGFRIPTHDQIWALAYRIERVFRADDASANGSMRLNAQLFGAALKASVIKSGLGECRELFRRKLRDEDGVLVDDAKMMDLGLVLTNVLDNPEVGDFGEDWTVITEDNGYSCLANNHSICELKINVNQDGFLVIRTYSIAKDLPYEFSVIVEESIVYRHCVTGSESHLAKIFVPIGSRVFIYLHDDKGEPISAPLHSRIIPKFIPLKNLEA